MMSRQRSVFTQRNGSLHEFKDIDKSKRGKLHLANNVSTGIKAAESIVFTTNVNGNEKNIILNDFIYLIFAIIFCWYLK